MKSIVAALFAVAAAEQEWFDEASAELRELQHGVTYWGGNITDATNPFRTAFLNPANGQFVPVNYDSWDVECKVTTVVGGTSMTLTNMGMIPKTCCDAAKTRISGLILHDTTGAFDSLKGMAFNTLSGCPAESYVPAHLAAVNPAYAACVTANVTISAGVVQETPYLMTGFAIYLGGSVNFAENCSCWNAQKSGLQSNTGSMHTTLLAQYGDTCDGGTSSFGYGLPLNKITTTTTTTTTQGTTTTTTTTTKAYKVEIKGTVGMTVDTPATCDTTAEMATTACAGVKGALEEGICAAIKAKQTTANQANITCSGAGSNFAAVLTLSRRQLKENQRALAAKTVSAAYTLTVQVATTAAADTFADAVIAAQPTAAEVKSAVETAVTAGSVAGLTITSVDSVSTPTKAVTSQVEALAIHSAVASMVLIGASLML